MGWTRVQCHIDSHFQCDREEDTFPVMLICVFEWWRCQMGDGGTAVHVLGVQNGGGSIAEVQF